MKTPSASKRRAIVLVAKGVLSTAAIAAECGVVPRTVTYWLREREFQLAVEAELRPWLDKLRDGEVNDRNKRLERLNADRLRLLAIRDARAFDPSVQDVPGGKTGLIFRSGKRKMVPLPGGAKDGAKVLVLEETEEFRVDYRMLAELREIEEQAARELGQRVDKHLHIRSFRDLTDEELDALIAEGLSEFGEEAVRA